MKIVVTGASGFVAGLLIPRLLARGADLLLVSRDPVSLKARFPECLTSSYGSLAENGLGFDLLVHLAALNNHAAESPQAFARSNVDHLIATYRAATEAKITRFVDVSTVHALDQSNLSPYAMSKRAGTHALSQQYGSVVCTVYLAAVYGEQWSGQLSILNYLPHFVAKRIFPVLAAVKPTVHIDRFVDYLLSPAPVADCALTDGQLRNPVYRFASRALAFVVGTGILVGFGWALAALWIAVRLGSEGPGIFSQQRLGKGGRPFICYKFRTMALGTRHLGTHEVPASAITQLGRKLRVTKLDELPQAWNLVRGDMNLVGPRPGLANQTDLASARTQAGVLELVPGITGLAQVNGIDMSDPERLADWDSRYLALQSLALDGKLLLATVTGAGRGDPAQQGFSRL